LLAVKIEGHRTKIAASDEKPRLGTTVRRSSLETVIWIV
jgi:hypothetical protein